MSGDNAIKTRGADRLGRSGFADQLTSALLSETADEGLVVALVGSWGQGKSSVLNMVREQLESTHSRTVLMFNPWMFAGQSQLIGAFFEQVAGQLRLKGKAEQALADRLIGYGQALSPLVFVPVAGAWLGRVGAMATAIGQARTARKQPDPVEQQRQAIEAALSKLTEPIFVFIDDIDRLTAREIRDMLGLVRLTAHFPKIIYLLAFDRAKVERALDQDDLEGGRNYLDKIVELSFDLPATSPHALGNLLIEGIDQAVSGIQTGPFDAGRWQDVAARILLPLLSAPRDINRYLAALPASLRMIGEEVALADVLALEAVRLRLPDVFAQLGPMSRALTDVGMITSQTPGWQAEVDAFIQSAGEHGSVVRDLCRLLFPATVRYLATNMTYPSNWLPIWRKKRQVANPHVLAIYLSKQLPPGTVSAATVEMAVLTMARKELFQTVVDSLSADELDDFLARLAGYEDEITADAVLPGCTVLLELYPRLRSQSKGFLDMGPEIAVDRVILQLLRRIDEEAERARIVEELCTAVAGFVGRIRLLQLVGRRPNPDMERLIPAAESDRLFRQVCAELRHASAAQVAAERDPLGLLATALAEDPADRGDIDHLLQDDAVAAALLAAATTPVRALAAGNVAVPIEQVLRWRFLGTVVGDDTAIASMVDRVAAALADDEATMAVVVLARKYLAGWRPSEFPFASSEPVIRQALNHPHTTFSPSVSGGGWPALVIRAVTTYEVDSAWAARADVSGAEFHHRLTAFLDNMPLSGQIAALAGARDLPADAGSWKPDPDAQQFGGGAVQRLIIGPADQPAAVLRYAVFLPGNAGQVMKLITDIAVSPGEATDAKWGKLGLEEIRDVLASALEAVGGPLSGQLVRSIYSGEMPPRTTAELYLWSGHGQSSGRSSITLNNTIDLDALGTPARTDIPALQGMFAVAGNTPTSTLQDCRNLVIHALIRMAIDWGYLDARARLVPLAGA
jgi:predicted KAP-like P-loop ATPase